VIPENAAGVSTDPATRAYIHVLRALGLQQREIGDRLNMSRKAVQNALSATAERVRDGEDPLDVYAEVLAPILTVGPPAEADADAGGDADPDIVPDGGLDIRALREFEADKNAVYSELADLIGEYGYAPTLAACAELVSRRVDDEMAEAYADTEDGDDVVPDGGEDVDFDLDHAIRSQQLHMNAPAIIEAANERYGRDAVTELTADLAQWIRKQCGDELGPYAAYAACYTFIAWHAEREYQTRDDARTDGGLPTRAAVADAIRACHEDGLTHIKMRHICARLDGHERDQTGVAKSVGQTCARFAERGALEQWSGSRGSGRSVWEIADVGALPRPTGRADGGDRSRECHACGADTTLPRCGECNAVTWTDYPVDHDPALIRATRLRDRADCLETRAAGRPDGGDKA
jgi:hypothetical protein